MMFFIIKKKRIIYFALIILVICFTCHGYMMAISNNKPTQLLVLVDPGHGEPDGGCIGSLGTIEQEINLKVAKKITEILEAKNINTMMTRNNSLGLWSKNSSTIRQKKLEDMNTRLNIIKTSKADLFISIHMNSFPQNKAHGIRIFYDRNHEEIKELAQNIQSRMSDITGAGTSTVTPCDRSLYLLKNTPMPAILIECGFLSNPSEENKLNSSEYQAKLAWAISDAIEKYYLQRKINQ